MLSYGETVLFPVGVDLFKLFKVNYKNTRKRCEISLKLTKNVPKKVVYKTYLIQISIYHLVRKVILVVVMLIVMLNFKSL